MSTGQTRVLVLLLVLLGLEVLRMPVLKTWFQAAWSGIGSGINAGLSPSPVINSGSVPG